MEQYKGAPFGDLSPHVSAVSEVAYNQILSWKHFVMRKQLETIIPGSTRRIFHFASDVLTHNPTGTDPTPEQWAKIADVIQEKNHIPFFDVAYQGFASGSLDEDATSVRLFAERGMEFFVAQSYSKNLGLYAERIGAINVVCSSADAATRVRSQLKRICSAYVLESTGSWGEDCGKCSGRFNYSDNMTNKWHVYITKDGRISLAGLSTAKCEYLADAIINSYHSALLYWETPIEL
ncbi:hypothetical protein YC2023_087827 [Brassica napus]